MKTICWDTKEKEIYKDKMEEIGWRKEQGKVLVESIWEKLKEMVKNAMVYNRRKIRKKEIRQRLVGQKLYEEEKKSQKKIYKIEKWKEHERRIFRKEEQLKDIPREEKKEKKETELRRIKNETEVWKFINKKRRKNNRIENNIGKEEWVKHFQNLLEKGDKENLSKKKNQKRYEQHMRR